MTTVAELAVAITAQNSASDVLHQVQRDLDATHKAAIAAGVGLTALGATMAAGLVAAGHAAASFEQAVSQVTAVLSPLERAASGPALRDLALTLGRDTVYSANEAASALEELVKAGVSVSDVMGGAAAASLNLAAAGGVSVKEAATIAANAMNAFGLSGEKVGAVVDTIAGAANASAIDVSQFGLSLAQVGAVANLAGLDFGDTATAIALLGNAGIKGADAGTSLKVMLTELIPKADGARAEMERLGIITAEEGNRFFDAAGKTKSFAEIAGVLATATAGLTEQQKLFTFHQIFGTDGMRAAAIAANAGADGVRNLTTEMGKVSALEVAHERLNNLNGDMKLLTSSLETLAITFGGSLAPAMRPVTQEVTNIVNALAGMPPAAIQTAAALATIATGATLLAGSVLVATGAAAAMGTTLGALAIAAAPVVIPIAAIGVALGALAAAWINDWGGIQSKSTDANGAIQADLKATGAGLATLGGQAHDATVALGELLGRFAEWDARGQQNAPTTSLGPLQTSQGANLAQLFPDRSQAVEILAQAEELGRAYAHSLADSLENGLQEQRMGERLAGWASQEMNALGVPLSAALVTATEEAVTTSVDNPVIHAQFTDWGAKIASEVGASLQANKGSVQGAIAELLRVEPNAGLQDLGVAQIIERGNALKATQQILATLTPAEQAHYQVMLLAKGADDQANQALTVLNAMRAQGTITAEQYNNALERGSTGLAGQTAKTVAHTQAVKDSTTAVLSMADAEKQLANAAIQAANAVTLAQAKGVAGFTAEATTAQANSVLQALTAGQGPAAEGWAKYVTAIGQATEATREWAAAHQLDATLVEQALNGDTAAMKRLTDEIKRAQDAAAKGIQLSSNISAVGVSSVPAAGSAAQNAWEAMERRIIEGAPATGQRAGDALGRGVQAGVTAATPAISAAVTTALSAGAIDLNPRTAATGGRLALSPGFSPAVNTYLAAHPMGPQDDVLTASELQHFYQEYATATNEMFSAALNGLRTQRLEQLAQAAAHPYPTPPTTPATGRDIKPWEAQAVGRAEARDAAAKKQKEDAEFNAWLTGTQVRTAAEQTAAQAANNLRYSTDAAALGVTQLQMDILKMGLAADSAGQGMDFAGAASARAGAAALQMSGSMSVASAAAAAASEQWKLVAANAQALMAGQMRNAGVAGGVTEKGLTYTQIMGGQTPGSSTGISTLTPGNYYGLPVVSPLTPGTLRGFADGGMVMEPTYLTTARTGRTFGLMAEHGPESIGRGGTVVVQMPVTITGSDALRDPRLYEQLLDRGLTQAMRKRGLV